MAIFRISLGWIVMPTLSQRVAPLRVMPRPGSAVAISRISAGEVERDRQPHQLLRRHLGDDEQDARASSMLRPWSTKRVPWSKPAEYIVTRPAQREQDDGEDERAVEAGQDRPGALPERRAVEDRAHLQWRRSAADRRPARGRSAAPTRTARRRRGNRLGARGRSAVDRRAGQRHGVDRARHADRRRRLAELDGGDVGLARVLARAAGSRTRGGRSAPRWRRRSRRSRRSARARSRGYSSGANAVYSAWSRCRSSIFAALYFSFALIAITCAVPVLPPVL